MGLSCKILRVNNEIELVEAPNGEESILYRDALERTKSSEQALNLWTLPYTIGFKEVYGDWESGNSTLVLDSNKEPKLEDALQYSKYVRNEGKKLSKRQVFEISNNLVGSNISSFEDLFLTIREGFYPKGVFEFNKEALINSNLYTESEINNILSNTKLQTLVKKLVEVVENEYLTDNYVNLEETLTAYGNYGLSTVVNTDEVIGLGKYKVENPIVEEQNLLKELEGVTTEVELNNKLGNLPEFISNKIQSDSTYKQNLLNKLKIVKVIPEYTENGDILIPRTTENSAETLRETLIIDSGVSLEADLRVLTEADLDVWSSSGKEVSELLKDIEIRLVDANIDIIGLADSLDIKTREEVLDFVGSLNDFTNNINDGVVSEPEVNSLAELTDSYFDKSKEELSKVQIVDNKDRGLSLMSFKSPLNELETFSTYNLIKVGEDLYQKVNVIEDINTLYDTTYQLVQRNDTLLPKEAYYPYAFDSDNSFNLSKLRDINNKANILESIKKYVDSTISNSEFEVTPQTKDSLEKVVLYKALFSHSLIITDNIETTEEIKKVITFKGKVDYLKGEFKADFQNYILKEKLKNSYLYNNALTYFKITEKGIELNPSDDFTVRQVSSLLPSNSIVNSLNQYTKMSKENSLQGIFPNTGIELDTDISKADYRKLYVNNKTLLDSYKGQYELIDSKLVIPFKSDLFLRVDNRLFEKVGDNNTSSIYSELPINTDPFYKDYSTTIKAPSTKIDLKLNTLETPNVVDNIELLTRKEKTNLNKTLYGCG